LRAKRNTASAVNDNTTVNNNIISMVFQMQV